MHLLKSSEAKKHNSIPRPGQLHKYSNVVVTDFQRAFDSIKVMARAAEKE